MRLCWEGIVAVAISLIIVPSCWAHWDPPARLRCLSVSSADTDTHVLPPLSPMRSVLDGAASGAECVGHADAVRAAGGGASGARRVGTGRPAAAAHRVWVLVQEGRHLLELPVGIADRR
jgi:hypothetical protein